MKYRKIEGLDKDISKLVFGTATPKLFAAVAENSGDAEKRAAYELLDEVYASGINTFDCASHYGEEITGQWMQDRGIRDKCVVITKCAHPNKWRQRVTDFDILSDAHDSLKKLNTDCIDIYMLHRDDQEVPVGTIVDTLNRLYDEGKVKVFGGSNWTHERIEAANEYAVKHNLEPFRVSSPNFGLAEQVADPWRCDARFGDGCVTISGPQNKRARAWYEQNKIPVFAYSSLARGFFSGAFKSSQPEDAKKIMDEPGIIGYYCNNNIERLRRCEILAEKKGISIAQTAMAWIYNQKFEVFALSSPVTKVQIQQNIAAINIELSDEELAWLNLE
ncbi:MAG: aldo/keto reductase [Lachnospiraceae bacterium]|nr:aldo/keto reductase [Lachnospiraceae bacterium]